MGAAILSAAERSASAAHVLFVSREEAFAMPGTSSVTSTGSQDINGLLSGVRWATTSLTYSFPTSASAYNYSFNGEVATFGVLDTDAQAAVRGILAMYSAVANLTFTERTGAQSGQGDLRYADTDAASTAWAYYPSAAEAGGDLWFHKSGAYGGHYNDPQKGDYGYFTYLHETGHALGLKHGHETDTYGALPANHDSLEYSVMTYRSYVGASTDGGYTNEFGGFPQTLMQDDIAALQYMYGANFSYNSGSTVYSWSDTTGEMFVNGVGQGAPAANKIFMAIWDGGGVDTYDFSNYGVNVTVDLRPGGWNVFNNSQRAELGDGHYARNIANALLYQGDTRSLIENAIGGSASDHIDGNDIANVLEGRGGGDNIDGYGGNDTLVGGAGNDNLWGNAGTDVARYSGSILQYALRRPTSTSFQVTDQRGGSPEGSDNLEGVEQLAFADYTATSFVANGSGAVTRAQGTGFTAFYDPADLQDWSAYLETYNGSGQRLTQAGNNDDGTSWKNAWDPGNVQIWSHYSESFNASGARANQIGTYDSGARWTNNWDVNNDQVWSFYSEQFNTSGVQADQIGTYDNGARWSNNWDANNDQVWSFYSEYYNVAGVKANQIGTYDSGARWSNNWDADNNQVWSYYSEYYTTAGVKANQIGNFDSGARWSNNWDANNNQAWSYYSEYYLPNGNRANQLGVYDDGSQWKNYWDADSSQAWQFYTENWNAAGQMVNRITTWDDGSQTTETFGGAAPLAEAGAESAPENGALASTAPPDEILGLRESDWLI
jgi:serralysin